MKLPYIALETRLTATLVVVLVAAAAAICSEIWLGWEYLSGLGAAVLAMLLCMVGMFALAWVSGAEFVSSEEYTRRSYIEALRHPTWRIALPMGALLTVPHVAAFAGELADVTTARDLSDVATPVLAFCLLGFAFGLWSATRLCDRARAALEH